MKTARRSFLQAAAALAANIPFAGRLFAKLPEPQPTTTSDVLEMAAYEFTSNGVWASRVHEAADYLIPKYVGNTNPRHTQFGYLLINVLRLGNGFAAWDELWWDQQIVQFNCRNVELLFDPRTDTVQITAFNPRNPHQRMLFPQVTHFRLFNTIGSISNKGWALPPYFDPKQMMPTAAELVAWFNVHTLRDFQKFMAAKPW